MRGGFAFTRRATVIASSILTPRQPVRPLKHARRCERLDMRGKRSGLLDNWFAKQELLRPVFDL